MPKFNASSDLLQYRRLFGLIGYPLSHSFSKKYFTQKFEEEGITNSIYALFPLETIRDFPELIQTFPNFRGLNVTIPYKEQVIPYLDELDAGAAAIGAVNTILVKNNKLIGYNTDAFGFESSLKQFLKDHKSYPENALILGTGGAAKAVMFVLDQLGIAWKTVSRDAKRGNLTYENLKDISLDPYLLIINTSPVGMAPAIENYPDIPYHCLGNRHLLYDLVYNPSETTFLQKGKQQGAATMNGLAMLYGQAERAWSIWNQ